MQKNTKNTNNGGFIWVASGEYSIHFQILPLPLDAHHWNVDSRNTFCSGPWPDRHCLDGAAPSPKREQNSPNFVLVGQREPLWQQANSSLWGPEAVQLTTQLTVLRGAGS